MPTDSSRAMGIETQIPKSILTVLNQLYEVEQKLKRQGDPGSLGRNIGKMKDALAEEGFLIQDAGGGQLRIRLVYEDPMGQPFKETRTDLIATIAGAGMENLEDLVVVEVVKPIIRATWKDGAEERSRIAQRGVVIVESQKEQQRCEYHD